MIAGGNLHRYSYQHVQIDVELQRLDSHGLGSEDDDLFHERLFRTAQRGFRSQEENHRYNRLEASSILFSFLCGRNQEGCWRLTRQTDNDVQDRTSDRPRLRKPADLFINPGH
jgi:hypothetical protein